MMDSMKATLKKEQELKNSAVAVKSLEETERHMYTMYVQYTSI